MNKKDKLTEATIKALQGKLLKENKYNFDDSNNIVELINSLTHKQVLNLYSYYTAMYGESMAGRGSKRQYLLNMAQGSESDLAELRKFLREWFLDMAPYVVYYFTTKEDADKIIKEDKIEGDNNKLINCTDDENYTNDPSMVRFDIPVTRLNSFTLVRKRDKDDIINNIYGDSEWLIDLSNLYYNYIKISSNYIQVNYLDK